MKYDIVELEERHFIGLKKTVNLNKPEEMKISELWRDFSSKNTHIPFLNAPFIGLETYNSQFSETKEFDYYAMGQIDYFFEEEGFVTVTLPPGKFIKVEITVKELFEGVIPKIYDFVRSLNQNIDYVLDYEEYPININMTDPSSKMYIVLKLK